MPASVAPGGAITPETHILPGPELARSFTMKRILVAIKRVVDYNIRIRVQPG